MRTSRRVKLLAALLGAFVLVGAGSPAVGAEDPSTLQIHFGATKHEHGH